MATYRTKFWAVYESEKIRYERCGFFANYAKIRLQEVMKLTKKS
jgi:hypothetical protein